MDDPLKRDKICFIGLIPDEEKKNCVQTIFYLNFSSSFILSWHFSIRFWRSLKTQRIMTFLYVKLGHFENKKIIFGSKKTNLPIYVSLQNKHGSRSCDQCQKSKLFLWPILITIKRYFVVKTFFHLLTILTKVFSFLDYFIWIYFWGWGIIPKFMDDTLLRGEVRRPNFT